jgi:hypothetical protein
VTILAAEFWSGASGAALPAQWTTSIASGGSAAQSGAGYATLNPGASGAYLNTWAYLTGMSASVDTDVSGWFSSASLVESYQAISVRATSGTAHAVPTGAYTTTGYSLLCYYTSGGAIELDIGKAGLNVAGATATKSGFTANQQVNYRLRVTGTTSTRIQARIWTGASEPATWDIDVADSSSPQTTPGKVRIGSTNLPGRWGPLTVTDAATTVVATPVVYTSVADPATLQPAPNPPPSSPIDVRLFNYDYLPMGTVTDYISCSLTWKYMAVGDGQLVVSETDPVAPLLLSVADPAVVPVVCKVNGQRWSGRVISAELSRTGPPGTGTVTATLVDDWVWLRSMLASQHGADPSLALMPVYDTRTGGAATLAAQFINAAVARLSSGLGYQLPVTAIVPTADDSQTVTISARMQTLEDLLTDPLTAANVNLSASLWLPGDPQPAGIGGPLSAPTIVFAPRLVAEKPWLQWSDLTGGITTVDYTVHAPTATSIILGGEGQDVDRVYFGYEDTTAQALDGRFALPEGYVDVTDVADATAADVRGRAELTKFRNPVAVSIEVEDGTPWTFGPTGYQVGDLASLNIGPTGRIQERVSRVTVTDDREKGLVYAPTVGDPNAAQTSDEMFVRAVSTIAQQTRLLQTSR